MISFITNPGSGPVADATEECAIECIQQFITDLHQPTAYWAWGRRPELDKEGRFGFTLNADYGATCEVLMPGLPIERVRFFEGLGQDIWQYPRLYVDGQSWIWCFALPMVHRAFHNARERGPGPEHKE